MTKSINNPSFAQFSEKIVLKIGDNKYLKTIMDSEKLQKIRKESILSKELTKHGKIMKYILIKARLNILVRFVKS